MLTLRAHQAYVSLLDAGEWPVVIAGGGPTGLALSALLSKFGIASLLLERSVALTQHPQVSIILFRMIVTF